jgi:HAD superfamily hydrolase (TIGR01509 family)
MTAVVFDIGQVLVRWDPVLAFLPSLGDRATVDAFLARTDFAARNLRADGGERFSDLADELEDDGDAAIFRTYVANYARAIPEPIAGTWALLDRLRNRGHAIHAITNWSAETWPTGVATHPRLGTAFGVTIVSGEVGLLKPDPRIFELLCARAGVVPADCVFIDDSAKNVAGAQAVGMDGIHFTDPAALHAALAERGLL